MKSNKKRLFNGTCTALVTPFKNGKIDYPSLKALIEFQISSDIDALLICGTTGESATLSQKEKQALISFAAEQINKRVPLIAGTGSNDTKSAIKLSKFAKSAGADGILLVTPYYNKASDTGLIAHYSAIASEVDLPIILYNVPSRTGVNIPLEVYVSLAERENIVAVKEASGNIPYLAKLAQMLSGALDIYSGNDDLILPTLSLGGAGVISVISNALPKQTSKICKLWNEGKIKEATATQLELLPLINSIFSEVNPIPIKALLAHQGMCNEEYRLPLCPMNEAKKTAMLNTLAQIKKFSPTVSK